jgi:hypothetical protein
VSETSFNHKMFAHCESGTVTALLNHAGLEISEPLVFGISSGIFFGYLEMPVLPFPRFIVRSRPGEIRKNIAKRLNVKFAENQFRNREKGKQALDELLNKNIPTAIQVDFFYMDYLPQHVRVHNNMHYIIALGKQNGRYIVSDCYAPSLTEVSSDSLKKARFAGGSFAPNGFLFYPTHIPEKIDLNQAVRTGIKKAAINMVKLPVPFIGVKGIRLFAKKVVEWSKHARDLEHLSHEVMMINVFLEDQGTGGAGFRFMFAAFLRKASEMLDNPELLKMSKRMMANGDEWRNISLFAARIGKRRELGEEKLKELSGMIMARADEEESFFNELLKMNY